MNIIAPIPVLLLACMCVATTAEEGQSSADSKPDILVVTIATKENDGFRQFKRSVEKYGLDLKVFGMGVEWRGGTMETVGGGHKVNLLKKHLKEYKNKENLLIMFVDSYDLVFTEGKDVILEKFAKLDARIVFGAEDAIWPDKSLEPKYPPVKENEKRFLNSGGFIGYAPDVYDIVSYEDIKDHEDDQLYYTHIFLNRALRHEYKMKLDTRAEIFQNLHLALGEIVLKYKGDHSYLYNLKTGTKPVTVHGNGPIKPEFYRLSNYLADGWTTSKGCLSCQEDLIDLSDVADADLPTVMIAMFVEEPTPYLREFFERVSQLDYPKDKIDVYLHYLDEYSRKDVDKFLQDIDGLYNSVKVVAAVDNVGEAQARNYAINECIKKSCGYMLSLDSVAQITDPEMLKDLISQNRSIVAPLMKRPGKMWSNFWGALSKEGYYARSEDYMDIAEYQKVGLWNVPFVSIVLLIQGSRLPQLKGAYTLNTNIDPDMSFCEKARKEVVFTYVTNRKYYGHLIITEGFETHHLHNELFNIFSNRWDWENRYIHKNYSKQLEENAVIEMVPQPSALWQAET